MTREYTTTDDSCSRPFCHFRLLSGLGTRYRCTLCNKINTLGKSQIESVPFVIKKKVEGIKLSFK